MSRLPNRAALAACLLLSTPFAFQSALADAPSAPATVASQTLIVLQHTVPSDILTLLHWDHAELLPAGVSSVTAQPTQNALSVVATPVGLATVRTIVSILDIEPRQVQIKSALATATDAQLEASRIDFALVPVDEPPAANSSPEFIQYATGKPVAALLASLTKQQAVSEGPIVETSNNTKAQMSCAFTSVQKEQAELHFQVAPRINSDNSVTLALDVAISQDTADGKTDALKLSTLRTVKDGETTVMGKKTASGTTLLLFVTPIIVPQK